MAKGHLASIHYDSAPRPKRSCFANPTLHIPNLAISGFPNLELKSDPSPKNIMSTRLTLVHFTVGIYLFSLHFSVLLHLLRHILNLAHPIVLVCLVFLI